MILDFSKLKGRIIEKYGIKARFAEKMNMDESTLSDKLNNKTDWTRAEIIKVIELLEIPIEQIPEYFFDRVK